MNNSLGFSKLAKMTKKTHNMSNYRCNFKFELPFSEPVCMFACVPEEHKKYYLYFFVRDFVRDL